MQLIQPCPSKAQQGDLELLRLVVHAHRRGVLGEEDHPHIALLITDCFGGPLEEIVEHAWSGIEAVMRRLRDDLGDDDAVLAAMINIAYQAFWLALSEASDIGWYHHQATHQRGKALGR